MLLLYTLMVFSPLEQFAIIRLLTLRVGGLDLSITNSFLMTVLGLSLLLGAYVYTLQGTEESLFRPTPRSVWSLGIPLSKGWLETTWKGRVSLCFLLSMWSLP